MLPIDLIIEILLAVTLLAIASRRFNLSLPILLLLAGMAWSFIPGVKVINLKPDLVFLFFLPPLLYNSAWFISWRDVRHNMRVMAFLAIGLIIVTTLTVGVAGHSFINTLSWGSAFILGAIVSPTDAVAATAIIRQFSMPKRIVNIIEEESLLNDATALVIYSFAVGAVFKDDHFLFSVFTGRFLVLSLGGILLGLAVGWVVSKIWKYALDDSQIGMTFSFLVPYASYLPAQAMGVSAVLAVVSTGMYLGWRSTTTLSAENRLKGRTVWDLVIFLLNGFIFLATGMQFQRILANLTRYAISSLILDALLLSAVVILTRVVFVYLFAWLPRAVIPGLAKRDPMPSWQSLFIIAWSGMRGVVSLAAAFAIPLVYISGEAFPNRELILFLTFSVILTTLVFQGLTLPWIIRLLKIAPEISDHCDELEARYIAANAAIAKIDDLIENQRIASDTKTVTRMRAYYEERLQHVEQEKNHHKEFGDPKNHIKHPFKEIELEVLGVERGTIVQLRNTGTIDDEIMHRIERDIDLQELKIISQH